MSKEETISCPFCKESDFDLVGLKSHLVNGDCEVFNNISNVRYSDDIAQSSLEAYKDDLNQEY